MARKPRRTPRGDSGEVRTKAEELHGILEQQVTALTNEEGWMRYLQFRRRFHKYSINNQMLILYQRPDAEHVASFTNWKRLGRQVQEGAEPIWIYGHPGTKKTGEFEKDPKTGEDKEKTIKTRPKLYKVFDYRDTAPVAGARRVFEAKDLPKPHMLEGEDEENIKDTVIAWLEANGWEYDEEPLGPSLNGYTRWKDMKVVINSDREPKQQAKTALHEAAHVIMEHGKDMADYIAHRGFQETQAESVAFVVAGIFDVDTSDYSVHYVANWSHDDPTAVKRSAESVLKAVDVLVKVLDVSVPDEVDEETAEANLAAAKEASAAYWAEKKAAKVAPVG